MAGKEKPPAKESRAKRAADFLNTQASDDLRAMVAKPGIAKPGPANSAENQAAAAAARELLGIAPSPEIMSLGQKGPDLEFQELAKSLLKGSRINPEDSLDPGEDLAEPTLSQLLARKPVMSEMDILLARPEKGSTADSLRIAMLSNRDGSQRIYIGPKSLNDFLSAGGSAGAKTLLPQSFGEAQRAIANRYIGIITEVDPGTLHPGLLKKMRIDPETAMLVDYAINAGNNAGINGIMYANQLYQESRFNPDAVSGKGARGISQMMPFQQGKYGLTSRDDFFDPYKSIDAGAAMMFEMTNKYKDQRLALVAYNGGERAIQFVEAKLGKGQITYPDWHGFMENRRSTNPTNDPSAWQNETKNYVDVIAGRPTAQERKTGLPEPTLK